MESVIGPMPVTGGPAFPCEGGPNSGLHADSGMTLRDYFAAKVLASPMLERRISVFGQNPLAIAEEAYKIADAMLTARSMR
jgi:hypothetical protein